MKRLWHCAQIHFSSPVTDNVVALGVHFGESTISSAYVNDGGFAVPVATVGGSSSYLGLMHNFSARPLPIDDGFLGWEELYPGESDGNMLWMGMYLGETNSVSLIIEDAINAIQAASAAVLGFKSAIGAVSVPPLAWSARDVVSAAIRDANRSESYFGSQVIHYPAALEAYMTDKRATLGSTGPLTLCPDPGLRQLVLLVHWQAESLDPLLADLDCGMIDALAFQRMEDAGHARYADTALREVGKEIATLVESVLAEQSDIYRPEHFHFIVQFGSASTEHWKAMLDELDAAVPNGTNASVLRAFDPAYVQAIGAARVAWQWVDHPEIFFPYWLEV